jgi:hypothetical protein
MLADASAAAQRPPATMTHVFDASDDAANAAVRKIIVANGGRP